MRTALILFLILLAVLIGVVQWRAATREAAAEADTPPVGRIMDVDGVPVHALVMGSGPDLVLIHGASGNLRDFTMGFAQRLAERYRVILFDRPGMGYTGRLPGSGGAWNTAEETPMAQAALLQKAADRLEVRTPIVLGHSFGGIVAIAWGLSRPDDTAALVLASAVSEPWPGGLGWTYTVNGSRLGGALFVPMVSAFVPESYVETSIGSIFEPQDAPRGYGDHLGTGLTLRRTSLRANAQQVNALRPHVVEMQKEYAALTMPIEAVHGDADTIVPAHIHAEVLMGDVPNGALDLLPGQGHMVQHTAPDAVIAAIDRAAERAGLR
ncbi:2-hydroxy-6-oxononadienedioate/2-hydroxy-6-oxononatrienedioate hydrolase [Sulfitobacter sp. THAF37]|uniref:alpha/beta fold hydrolase n=1 Tax=Sulfitobacter sp. THAF37 TaxID=2587855 RepID=UPI0012A92F22|nr:alpha/beta hydrolase [Sulfitobacter sp. THAF37]QFT59831.1 2-hydroxy-6-oxononadienedioate/2-hydroxy-6-oxononatrienedioate hydrolase [Sulfitobacter sp. THAF37]